MLYIGISLEYEEACRLIGAQGIEGNVVETFLEIHHSRLQMYYVDKNVWILGVPLRIMSIRNDNYTRVDDAMIEILQMTRVFHDEVKHLNIDLKNIKLARIEQEPFVMEQAEPCLLEA